MKVKPFYIRITKEMTPQIIQDAIDKCVDAGAIAEDCADRSSKRHKYCKEEYVGYWDSFGVNIDGETYFWDVGNGTDDGKFGGIQNEITLNQLDEWLGLDKTETQEGKEAFDSMANDSELSNGSEWNGEGLPPVGAECECLIDCSGKWRECEVLFSSKDSVVVVKLSSGSELAIDPHASSFRKPETPQQREERERAMAVYDMCASVDNFTEESNFWAGRFYDAGYRKAK